jgi:hypothetical protein
MHLKTRHYIIQEYIKYYILYMIITFLANRGKLIEPKTFCKESLVSRPPGSLNKYSYTFRRSQLHAQ